MTGTHIGAATGDAGKADAGEDEGTVADYKRLLQAVCDNRPSGTRGRLAAALGTNRSFVSQLVNPTYAMPIPAQHLPDIFEVCHFSPAERAEFLQAYDRAHPNRRGPGGNAAARTRLVSLRVPDLGDARNQLLDGMLAAHARQVAQLIASFGGTPPGGPPDGKAAADGAGTNGTEG